jgi:hypothetical protein
VPDYIYLLGTLVQETYATHPAIRVACDKRMSTHVDELTRIITQPLYTPNTAWSAESLAISSNLFCKARSFSPKRNKTPRLCGRTSRICGVGALFIQPLNIERKEKS